MENSGKVSNIEYLCEFVELANAPSFSKASKLLHVSQPALSKHIAKLEDELGITLFDRSGNSLRVTREGAALLSLAYQVIESRDNLAKKARQLMADRQSTLVISGFTDDEDSTNFIGHVIPSLSKKYGTDCVEIRRRQHRSTEKLLDDSTIDIVIDYASEMDFNELDVRCKTIERIPLIAVMSKDNPLARRDSISLKDLHNATLVKIEGSYISGAWRHIETVFNRHNEPFEVHRHYATNLSEVLTITANLGNCVLLMGSLFAKRFEAAVSQYASLVAILDEDAYMPLSIYAKTSNDKEIVNDVFNFVSSWPIKK